MIRAALAALACGIAASTAGAAAPLTRNGLIAFASDRSANLEESEVYVVRATGGPRTNVSKGTATMEDEDPPPSWSPDGKRLAFSGDEALVIANANGSSRMVLSEGDLACASWGPDWAADGRHIATAGCGVWLISTSSWTARRLVDPPADLEVQWTPAQWSPDGKRLAFTGQGVAGFFPDLYVVRRSGSGLRRLARAVSCCVSWSPSGRRLLFGDDFGRLESVDVRTGRRRRLNLGRLRPGDDVEAVWSPTGQWIAVPTTKALYLVSPDGRRRRRIAGGFGTPSWSPSGDALALLADGVYTLSLKSRRLRRVVRARCGETFIRAEWSPDGKRIAFASDRLENDWELYAMREDGSGRRQLTRNCERHEREPAWSPDGRRVAFVEGSAIYVMRGNGTDTRRLAPGRSPSWSPDGRRIVFDRFLPRTNEIELFMMGADGTRVRRLTSTNGSNSDPAWSPRGNRIAFVGGRPRSPQRIFVMAADGSHPVALAAGIEPSWSPDGSRLAFVREDDVWAMSADGTDAIRLTSSDGYTGGADDPAWSPDGTKIVYAADIDQGRGVQDELFVISATGGTPRMLPYERENSVEPSWQPLP